MEITMKKCMIALVFMVLCCMSGCDDSNGKNELETIAGDVIIEEVADESVSDNNEDRDREEIEMDAINRTMIAEALGIQDNHRSIRFILSSLNTISAGQIQSVELVEDNGEKVLNLVSEDGTNYQIYLSKSGNVEAVKNTDTGEWMIQSER